MDKVLPLMYRSDKLHCLVVGGGNIAYRKVLDLLNADIKSDIISPRIVPELEKIIKDNNLKWEERVYTEGDVKYYNLIIVATDNREVNHNIYLEASGLGIPVNVVDDPENCTVYFASVVRREPLQLAISTGGGAPFFARETRKELEKWADNGWALRAKWAEQIRLFALDNITEMKNRTRFFEKFMAYSIEEIKSWNFDNKPVDIWKSWIEQ